MPTCGETAFVGLELLGSARAWCARSPGFHFYRGMNTAAVAYLYIILTLGRWRQEEQNFKIILRPVWDT